LGTIYDLRQIGGKQTPKMKPEPVREWVEQGKFGDGSIFHHHWRYSADVCDALDSVGTQIVTAVRDPYDTFVSLYYWAQDRAAEEDPGDKVRARHVMVGKPLDHPDVLAFLRDGFGSHLRKANEWLHSGRGEVIRYEELHRDPVSALSRVTDRVAPVPPEQVAAAVERCKAENMRQMNEKLSRHVRSAKVGDSRERLSEAHLAIFRDYHADLIQRLGYEVR
jgi:hypothetical protein